MFNFKNNLKLSEYAVLRKEHFGGLLFNKKDKSIMELNPHSFSILSQIERGLTSHQILEQAETLGITKEEVVDFIDKLAVMELIFNA
jgi:DNA-binding MarR family transcriptional regulator